MLIKYPGLTLIGTFGMAGAIAIGAAVFSVLYTVVDPSLPLEEGDRVVAIQNLNAASGDQDRQTHLHDLDVWRGELRAVEDLGAHRTVNQNLITGEGQAEPLRVAEITASGFRVARVAPLLGRYLDADDELVGAPPVVVIGYGVWQNRFAGDPAIIGQTLRLDGTPHMVVGVMPEGFAFPVNNRIWTPLRLEPSDYERGEAPPIDVFGRLVPGATLEQVQAQLTTISRRMAAAYPDTHEHVRPQVLPYARSFLDSPGLAWMAHLIQLLVSLLLVAASANAAILIYARTATRNGEIAVRRALGASRARIVAQLFMEALLLAAAAAVIGLAGASFALQQLNTFLSRSAGEQLPFWMDFGLTPGTMLYAVALAVLAAVVAGVLPALKVTGRQVQSGLRELGGGTGMQMGRTWTALIAAQVAVAVAILPVTVMLGWSEIRPQIALASVPTDEVLTAQVAIGHEGVLSAAKQQEMQARFADRHAELVRRLEAEPGVVEVTFASSLPGAEPDGVIEVEQPRPGAEASRHDVSFLEVDPTVFDVFDGVLLAGRRFGPEDVTGTTTAVIANRSFVQRVLGGGEPLGRRFRYARASDGAEPGGVKRGDWYEIVGVVSDFPAPEKSGRGDATLYHPAVPGRLSSETLIVQVQGVTPEGLAGRLREITVALDPSLQLGDVRSLTQIQRQEQRTRRSIILAITMVTLSVLLFSAAGIHALISFTVTRRRREIGIRSALGAEPRHIVGSILAQALRQLGLGAAVGCLLGGALIGVSGLPAEDVITVILSVAVVILVMGLLAALGPGRRGLSIDPMEALRTDT